MATIRISGKEEKIILAGTEELVASDGAADKNITTKTMLSDRLLTKSVAGSADVALTATEAMYGQIVFTGALTGNISVTVPDATAKRFETYNSTTGAYTLTFKTVTGTGVLIPQGARKTVFADGTNVVTDTEPIPEAVTIDLGLPLIAGATGRHASGDVVFDVLNPKKVFRTARTAADVATGKTLYASGFGANAVFSADTLILSSGTIAECALNVGVSIPSGYEAVTVEFYDVTARTAVTSQATLARFNNSTAAAYDYNMYGARMSTAGSPAVITDGGRATSGLLINEYAEPFSADTLEGSRYTITVFSPYSVKKKKFRARSSSGDAAAGAYANGLADITFGGVWNGTAAITAVHLFANEHLFAGGKYKVWGAK